MTRAPDLAVVWAALPEPWRRCFELAWESHLAGSMPVGAAVVDRSGAVVAVGRNRHLERKPPDGQLAGTALAHAEVNALAGLPLGDHEQHVLCTTLEPCLLCTAALIHSHVGEVRYAATDHLWRGLDRLPSVNAHIARRWPRRVGPMTGPLAVWAAVLPLLWTLDRSPDGAVVAAHQQRAPALLDLARHLQRTRPSALEQDSLPAALHDLWGQCADTAERSSL